MAGTSILAKMSVLIDGQTAEFNKALKDSSSNLNLFVNNIKSIASTAVAAFSVREVANFAFEVSKLAGEAKGVKDAFNRLPDSVELLNKLKGATSNTVSELQLMKTTVQASNFGIGLQQLPELLKFAAIRAQQTGQSVDYLVQSIITGIGRKSPLILDNLGISAVRLKEKFNGAALESQSIADVTKAVGAIASEELGKMAGFSENASSKVQQLNASWEDYKVVIGEAANDTGVLGNSLTALGDIIDGLAGKNKAAFASADLAVAINEGMTSRVKDAIERLKELRSEAGKPLVINTTELIERYNLSAEAGQKLRDAINDINKQLTIQENSERLLKEFAERNHYTSLKKAAEDYIASLNKAIIVQTNLQQSLKQQDSEAGLPAGFSSSQINDTQEKIDGFLKVIQAVQKYTAGLKIEIPESGVQTITTLEADLKALQDQLVNTDITDTKTIETINKKSQALKEQIDLLRVLVALSRAATSATPDVSIIKKTGADFLSDTNTEKVKNFSNALDGLSDKWKKVTVDSQAFNNAYNQVLADIEKNTIDLSLMIAQGLDDFATALGQAAVGVGNFGDSILKAIAKFMSSFGTQLIALGTAKVAADLLFKVNGGGWGAIAAGVALVAVAAGTSALLSNSQKGFSSSMSGGGSSGGSSSSFNSSGLSNKGFEIQVGGELTIRGQDLVYIFNRQTQLNGRTKGG